MPPKRDSRRKSKSRPPARRPSDTKQPSGKPSGAKRRRAGQSTARPPIAKSGESGERLQKVLAAAGVASRRECEELILEGRVEVDHQVVRELGTRVDPERQEIRVDGESLGRAKLVYFAAHKPTGVVSTSRDPAGRPRVVDLLPPNVPRVYCVGRLDMSSEGLILVTNDGELANGLTHPRHGIEKIYHVQVSGLVEPEIVRKLERGVHLAEGVAQAKHVRIKSRQKKSSVLEMILDEGRNREIRRLLARLGHKVQRLRRVAVGPVRLGDLPAGAVRPLTRQEVTALHRSIAEGRKESTSLDESEAMNRSTTPNQRAASRSGGGQAPPKLKKRTVL